MNLSQIERRLQAVDFMANYVNYKYNPNIKKIDDLKQHIHKDLLVQEAVHDQAIYGLAAFQEGDPDEIMRGIQEMSVSGGPRRDKTSILTRQGASSRKGASPRNFELESTSNMPTRPTTAERSNVNISHQVKNSFEKTLQKNNVTNPPRPFTSRPNLMNYNSNRVFNKTASGIGANRKNVQWTMKQPLRHQKAQTGPKSQHLINRSKIKAPELQPNDSESARVVLCRHLADQNKKFLFKPRAIHDPTVYYKVGDYIKSKQEQLISQSPIRPVNLPDQDGLIKFYFKKLQQHAEKRKQDQFGDLMRQLYKIKIPDHILEIIHDSNFELKYRSYQEEPTPEQLMEVINTQYIQGLISSEGQSKRTIDKSQTITSQQVSEQKHSKFKALQQKNAPDTTSTKFQNNFTATLANSSKIILNKNSVGEVTSRQDAQDNNSTEMFGNFTQLKTNSRECAILNQDVDVFDLCNDRSQTKMMCIEEAERREFTKKLTGALAKTESVPEIINQTSSVTYEAEAFRTTSKPKTILLNHNEPVKQDKTGKIFNDQYDHPESRFNLKNNRTGLQSDLHCVKSAQKTQVQTQQECSRSLANTVTSGYFKKSATLQERTWGRSKSILVNPQQTQDEKAPIAVEANIRPQQSNDQFNRLTQMEHQSPKQSPKIKLEDSKPDKNNLNSKLLFNLKITDLTSTENPFVFYENQKVDKDGYLLFNCPEWQQQKETEASFRQSLPKASLFKSYKNFQQPMHAAKNTLNALDSQQSSTFIEDAEAMNASLDATVMLPWLKSPADLEKRTLKIEVTFNGELILLRIIHIDKLYPAQYPMLALQIANNMIQSNLLLKKNILVEDAPDTGTAELRVSNKTYIHLENTMHQKKLTKVSSMKTYQLSQTTVPRDERNAISDDRTQSKSGVSNPRPARYEIQDNQGQMFMADRKSGPINLINFPDSATHIQLKRNNSLIHGCINQSNTESKIINCVPPGQEAANLIEFECAVGQGEPSATDNETKKLPSNRERTHINLHTSHTNIIQPQNFTMPTNVSNVDLQMRSNVSNLDLQNYQPQQHNELQSQNPLQLVSQHSQISELGITRFRQKTGNQRQVHFRIRPQSNDILDILQGLESYEINVMNVTDEIKTKQLRQFPSFMQNLQVLIEFSDCIIQAKDLLNYEIVRDENEQRVKDTKLAAQQKKTGLPNQGKIQGVQCSPAKIHQIEFGIVKESKKAPSVNKMSFQRVRKVKSYVKNKAANFYVRHKTNETRKMIQQCQRDNAMTCANDMKSKVEQFQFLQNSMALQTSELRPIKRTPIDVRGGSNVNSIQNNQPQRYYLYPGFQGDNSQLMQKSELMRVVEDNSRNAEPRYDLFHQTLNGIETRSMTSPQAARINPKPYQIKGMPNQTYTSCADTDQANQSSRAKESKNLVKKHNSGDQVLLQPGQSTIGGNATHSVPTMTQSQQIIQSVEAEDVKPNQEGIIQHNQIVITQNNKHFKEEQYRRDYSQTDTSKDLILRPSIKGLLRTTNNEDLDELRHPGPIAQTLNVNQIMIKAENRGFDTTIKANVDRKKHQFQCFAMSKNDFPQAKTIRLSEEFKRTSPLKQSLTDAKLNIYNSQQPDGVQNVCMSNEPLRHPPLSILYAQRHQINVANLIDSQTALQQRAMGSSDQLSDLYQDQVHGLQFSKYDAPTSIGNLAAVQQPEARQVFFGFSVSRNTQ